jgi:hypothetical protein
MSICVFDNVPQEACIWLRLICRRPINYQIVISRARTVSYFEFEKPSRPSAEYLIELSLASFARSPATYSSLKSSAMVTSIHEPKSDCSSGALSTREILECLQYLKGQATWETEGWMQIFCLIRFQQGGEHAISAIRK